MARYLQDIANDNADAAGFGKTDPFWIVRRTIIDVIRPFSWPGTVYAERWCGAASTRWGQHARDHGCEARDQPVQPGPT